MANRTIEIIIDIADRTGGKLNGIKNSLLAMDKAAKNLTNRFKAFSTQRYMATLALIDRATAPASRIQKVLQSIAHKTWQVSIKVADGALAGIRKIESALMRISGKVYNVAVNVKGAALSKLNGLASGALMGAGAMIPGFGVMGAGFGVANAIQAYAGFEKQMSRVQALRQLDKNSTEMQSLRQQAKDLGMTTAWTRKQVGEAQEYMALAGWNTQQMLKATPHMLNLASAGQMDLGSAADMLTDAMTAFGLKATDRYRNARGRDIDLPEYFADMLAKVQASSNTDLYQLKEGIKYGAPTIGTMFANVSGQEGVQLRTEAARQMMIMLGLMANAGIKGSMGGTGVNTLFNRLAGENRNTHFAEKLLGLEHAAENGNMIMPLDFIKAFRNKIQGGMSVDDFLQVAEELSGEKIHADTRRKINSTIENALKNGGRLGSSDMLKIGSMMAGLENAPKLMAMVFQDIDALEAKMNDVDGTAKNMADTMLDNLAGSFVKLGSAWDAFQQDLLEGQGGEGIRNFVDALTEMVTHANKLFADGIDIPDFGKMVADVVTRLKNKFLELDGIGSILAGGALVAGLMKIISLSQRALAALKSVTAMTGVSGVAGARGAAAGIAAAQKVGTMTVSAGVVNVNGKISGGGGGGVGGRGGGSRKNNRLPDFWVTPQRQNANAIMADYQAVKNYIRGEQASKIIPPAAPSRFAGFGSAAGSGAAFAGIFGLLDILNTRSIGQERLAAATTDSERSLIMRQNRQAEWQASGGALGSIAGAALGAAVGSMAGPLGTAIGGVIGGMLGDAVGRWFGEKGASHETVRNGLNKDLISQEVDKYFTRTGHQIETPDYSFGQKNSKVGEFSYDTNEILKWRGQVTTAAKSATQEVKTLEQTLNQETSAWVSNFKRQSAEAKNFTARWQGNAATPEVYRAKTVEGSEFKPLTGLSEMLSNLFFSKAAAAELTPEQMSQQAEMERGESVTMPTGEMPEQPPIDEWLNFDGITERLSELGAQITEGLSAAMEGAGELVSELGSSIMENLSSAMEGAGEIFNGIGEQISSALAGAGDAASSALSEIQSAFQSAKESVQSSWAELPGFFSGVFSGLGGAASSAGAAIYSGLTSVIGSIIGAWQSAAATISGIISSIAASASAAVSGAGAAVAGAIGIGGHAEGGFVTSPELSWVGEKGAELILPLTDKARSLELLNQASGILGLNSDEGGMAISGSSSSTANSSSGNVTFGDINISFEVTGTGGEQSLMSQIESHGQEVGDIIAAKLASAIASVNRNQALSA